MKANFYFLLVLVFNSSCGLAFQTDSVKAGYEYDLAIQNVRIFDSEKKRVLNNKTIFVKGDSIAEIVDNSKKYSAERIIEGDGRLIVPGFIDTHMHLGQIYGDGANGHQERLVNDDSFRGVLSDQYLAYGTTTVVDMGQYEKWMEVSLGWQKNPHPDYPNLFLSSTKLISSGDEWPYTYEGFEQVMNEKDARETVRKYAQMGIRYVKLYKWLRKPEMRVVVDEVHKQNMIVFAHTDMNIVTIREAMDLGVSHFEHFFTLVPSVLNMDEYWPKVKEKYKLKEVGSIDEYGAKMIFFFDFIKSNPELSDKLTTLLERMARENSTISTAVHPMASAAGMNYPGSFSSWNSWPMRKSSFLPNYNDETKKALRKAFATMMGTLKDAQKKGVKIRIGTDCRYGGKAILSEMMLMHEAGFKMEDILSIATWNGAEATDIQDNYGSVTKGKKADLVLFDKNPFDDYKNLIGRKTVIKGGKIFENSKSEVQEVLAEIKKKGIKSAIETIENFNGSPLSAETINEVGYELMKNGKISDAIHIFKKKNSIYGASKIAYNNLLERYMYYMGYHLTRTGNIKDAILLYKYNIELFPKSGYAYYSLAETYMEDGKKGLAIPLYKKAIELDPESDFAKEVLEKLENIE